MSPFSKIWAWLQMGHTHFLTLRLESPLLKFLEITPVLKPARTCVSYSSLDLVPKRESFLFISNSIYKFNLLNMEKISAASEKLVNS